MNEKVTEAVRLLRKAVGLLDEQPLEDGWIPWHGGECQVPDDTQVEVKFRNGNTSTGAHSAYLWSWMHYGVPDYDIIAYRVVDGPKPDTEDHTKATGMPPVGWVVEVWNEGDTEPYLMARYNGKKLFETRYSIRPWDRWCYIRPPKSAAPEWARAYVVFSTHVSEWVSNEYAYVIGEKAGLSGTVLAVIPVEELE